MSASSFSKEEVLIEELRLRNLIPSAWATRLGPQMESTSMEGLEAFLEGRRASDVPVYPPADEVFSALNKTPPSKVRVVIFGQDPYHGPRQAHGLCFSVNRGIAVPPSLRNIFRELRDDLGVPAPEHGCLDAWAEQGVLLLNTVLTVEDGSPGSHRDKGWEAFTDGVIALLNATEKPLVFMLWGAQAQKKASAIDGRRHYVLKAPHPSPLSAHRGFFGCGHFGKANAFLTTSGETPIDWSLSP